MSDNYQAVYDAVRSRMSNCDVAGAVEQAVRDAGIGDWVHRVAQGIQQAVSFYESPSVIYRPKISIDGNMWCALYGDNVQDGVAGFGKSPVLAMADFDKNWFANLKD